MFIRKKTSLSVASAVGATIIVPQPLPRQLELFDAATLPPLRQFPTRWSESAQSCFAANDAAETKLAWAAGLFDGEGCIYASAHQHGGRPNPNVLLQVSVAQNVRRVLEDVLEITGVPGRIYEVGRQQNHRRQCYSLVWYQHAAFEVLRRLLPYLRRKDAEAECCLRYERDGDIRRRPGPKGHSREIWEIRRRFVADLRSLK